MNKEKINDFINVWAKTLGLTDTRYINVIKSDIAKRCSMYEKEISSISVDDDKCNAYIIKSVDGKYSIEDFLLNRLMLGLREIDFTGALEGNSAEYIAANKTLNVNVELINSKIDEKSTRHQGLKGKNIQVIKKTIEHELGHCLKSTFTDGYKVPLAGRKNQDDIYEKLITNLQSFENGKYAKQIKSVKELPSQGVSERIKTGVHDANVNYGYDSRIEWIDELLNESEALELTNSNAVHEKWVLQDENGRNSLSGNYVDIYNYMSKYSTFTGYGSILKSLLGKEDCFYAEYISSVEVFNKFDKEYSEIVEKVWGIDPEKCPPTKCLFIDFNDLITKKFFDEKTMLKLDEFFAKCYEKKIDKIISQNNGVMSKESKETTLKEIQQFKVKLTQNNDPVKNQLLSHNAVFDNIIAKINEISLQEKQQKVDDKDYKMKFVKGFINAYNDSEEEYQYSKRAENELADIERLKNIIASNGMDLNLISDLEGKWIDTPSKEDFKVEYSQKQVSAMARLLKVAQLLTDSKKLNPEGRDYLKEFANIPNIEYRLKEMKQDLKDENSYIYEMKERAKSNRKEQKLPIYPSTKMEIELKLGKENSVLTSAITATEEITNESQIKEQEKVINQIERNQIEHTKTI